MATHGVDEAAATDGLTVGAAASSVGVTVRTLHHWDALGLVRPSGRTISGYRLYSATDLARIHRVLVYRELGMSLEDIGELLDAPTPDPVTPLRQQRAQLLDRIDRLRGMVGSIDRMIEASSEGILLSAEEQVAIFGENWQPSWSAGARERWGDTSQWAEYAERAASRDADDYRRIAATVHELNADLAAACRTGVSPDSDGAAALAERHRATIGEHFHCTHAMHVCIGRMHVVDADFAANYDTLQPGLARWLSEAIDANARAHGVDPDTADWG